MVTSPPSAILVVLAATENVTDLLVLFTVIAENPAGLVTAPIVKFVRLSSPSATLMTELKDTACGIVPLLLAVKIYSLTDCLIV